MATIKVVASNRKAYHDYHLEETFEAGVALTGTEIKSVRAGRVNLRDGYVQIKQGDAWLMNCHISPYDPASRENAEPLRPRRLLLHKRELARLQNRVAERCWTIVPLKVYLKDNRAKVEIALARGKRQYDKRESIAQRDAEREMEREMKERTR
ncbi:MAG: SsrA-binding protein SmpB [Anaerolineae bacterium]|nr:SsrA-binding protein SmpB [Anaerolineae bacterium]